MNIDKVKIQNSNKVELPQMFKIQQDLYDKSINNISKRMNHLLLKVNIENKIISGSKIGIAVGSRGIDRLYNVIKEIVDYLKSIKADPFIIPAMGTHGGATSRGQEQVLADYNICKESLGVPVVSSMETEYIGKTKSDAPIFFSKVGLQADGIIIVNRVKVHTDFSGYIESGLSKMMVIGLGKHKGASTVHSSGVDKLPEVIPEAAKLIIEKTPILLGIGLLENSVEELCEIRTAEPDKIIELDKDMLKKQKEILPTLPFSKLDVLIIEEIGKNISGTGMDTNVIGKLSDYINIKYIVVLSLTEESHGNATGIGLADFTTLSCYNNINFNDTYINCLTSRMINYAKIPIVLKDDETAIKTAISFSNKDKESIKIAKIKNTLELRKLYISKGLIEETKNRDDINLCDDNINFEFNGEGKLEISGFQL